MMETILKATSDVIDTSSFVKHPDTNQTTIGPEFDGDTVLCRGCGDRASGFHYGVHACEGCKGFFRRSIQQKIQYRPCLKNQQCNIQRVNRNRCQYCRLKKCIAVGMSRDAVRFGRVPKKEKARIIEQMQKKSMASQASELNSLLTPDLDVVHAVVTSHRQTCDISQFQAHQMRDLALIKQEFVSCPANMACPLNNEIGMDSNANSKDLSDFSESFTPAIKSVVDFAKGIPGFVLLNQDDQVTLLKAGTFEVLLVRLSCLFDPSSNTMMFTGGRLYKRQPSTMATNAGFLLDSMFDFAERFNKLCLHDDEIALFSAVVLLSPDRPGIRNVEQVERIQIKLSEALQNVINLNHKEDGTLFAKLLMKTTDLRTLNTLHSEKSIAGQKSSHIDKREAGNTEDTEMDFHDSMTPSHTESSNLATPSTYTGDVENGNVASGRMTMESANHQQMSGPPQVVLHTPYGTFVKEEMSGYYGMMSDQPRRRSNTLDRETLSRPRLHTIEEGNRRRYTLDRDYINKMMNRLSDRLDNSNGTRGESVPPANSATSSSIQEEGNSLHSMTQHSSYSNLSTSDLHTSLPTPDLSASPQSRSRSGSFTQEDLTMRPRCYSFHLNSKGRAARMPLQHRLMSGKTDDLNGLSADSSQYMSAEMRRGSVGTAYGLHARKQARISDQTYGVRGNSDPGSGSTHGVPMTTVSEFPNRLSSLWYQNSSSTSTGISRTISLPQSSRDGSNQRNEPDTSNSLPSNNVIYGERIHNKDTTKYSLSSEVLKGSMERLLEPADTSSHLSALIRGNDYEHDNKMRLQNCYVPEHCNNSASKQMEFNFSNTGAASSSQEPFKPFMHDSSSKSMSKTNLQQNSLTLEDTALESFGHKKFDKFRKDKLSNSTEDEIVSVKEEKMEEGEENVKKSRSNDNNVLKVDIKEEQGLHPRDQISPAYSIGSTPSPNSTDRPKISAKEAHPNLLAHLMNSGSNHSSRRSSPQTVSQISSNSPVGSSSPQASVQANMSWTGSGLTNGKCPYPSQDQHQTLIKQLILGSSRFLPSPPVIVAGSNSTIGSQNGPTEYSSSSSQNINLAYNPSSNAANINDQNNSRSKEDFHAATVSHLKDKLLRKTESLENFPKSLKEGSMMEMPTWSQSVSSSQSQHQNTAELNKELATKLTLSSSVTAVTSPRPVPSTVSTPRSTHQTNRDNSQPLTILPATLTPVAQTPQSSGHSIISPPGGVPPSLPHPAISQLLLSHSSPLPLYHNMFASHQDAVPSMKSNSRPELPQYNGLQPLANMQHLAQMFSHAHALSGEKSDRR